MTDEQIPIADVSLTEDEIEAAVDVLKSGYFVQGEEVSAFESAFAAEVGAEHAVAVSSGTAALHAAYLATLPKGADVLVPALSHVSTASMVSFAGCNPVFCDVDEDTYTIDVKSARKRVTQDTAAVVPVHLFGNVADVDAIETFAHEHDLTIVWDAAQAHAATYESTDVGAFDDLVTYSFYPTKNMTTTEGGMITTGDGDVAERCRRLRSHWQTEKYYHPKVGLNYRMTEVQAAIGRRQFEKLPQFTAERRENAAALTAGLEDVPEVTTPFVQDGVEHAFHQYTVQIAFDDLTCDRDEFQDALENEGVSTAVHYPRPLHEQPAFDTSVSLPTSERLCERVLSLPAYPELDEQEVDRIAESVEQVVEQFR